MSASEKRRRKRHAARRSEAAEYESASNFLKAVSGFDGANQSDRRGWIYWPTLDPKRELDSYSRTELLRKSRWLRANFGLATRICSGLADLLGYLTPVSNSGDDEWDTLADEHWADRAEEAGVIDAAGQFGIKRYQIELNKTAFADGDILPTLIQGSTGGMMLATYQAHQIRNPDFADKKAWIDGVRVNKFRRHLAYGVVDEEGKVKTISANDALYYSHPDDTGRIRPPTILAHAVNHMQDIAEILADIKLTIKVASQLGLYLKNQAANSGGNEGPRSLQGALRNELIEDSETTPDAPVQHKVEDLYRSAGGIANLPAGSEIGVIADSRPHMNQMNLLEYLVRDICWGVGVAPDILWNISQLGGANSRIANADLDRWISCRLLRLRSWLRRFRAIWLSAEMEAGRLPYPRGDAPYWKAAFIPQASLTADKGRIGYLNIALVSNRLRSLRTHYAEEGLDWENELRQIAREKKLKEELGLVFEELDNSGPPKN